MPGIGFKTGSSKLLFETKYNLSDDNDLIASTNVNGHCTNSMFQDFSSSGFFDSLTKIMPMI